MVSYFKSQWFNWLVGLVDIGLSIYHMIQGDDLLAVAWMVSAVVWLVMSRVDYNDDRIKLLEEKSRKYDALTEEVKALYEANRVDREYQKMLENKIKKLEEKK